jgi:putative endonuclease
VIRIFTSSTQKSGEKGENEAVSFLKKRGFKICGRNIPNKFGEIDIVAQKDRTTYFFEVKAGKQGSSILPAENLHSQKIRKFLRSVEYYCMVNKAYDYRVQGIIVLFSQDNNYTIETIDLF